MISFNNKSVGSFLAILALVFTINGCKKDIEGLEPATFPDIGDVFIDGFSPGLQYDSYDPAEGANVGAFEVVSDVTYEGDAAMRFAIPDPDNPDGSFAGGTFTVESGRDLSGFDALTFWMKASKNATVDLLGFGDEFTFGDSEHKASLSNVSVNSNWKQIIIPLPDPSLLTRESGMFWYSEGTGNDNGLGYTLWIDEVKFEKLGTLAQYRPAIQNGADDAEDAETGQNITITGLTQTVSTDRGDVTVDIAPTYFDFTSSNTSVVTVGNDGVAMVLDAGTAVITAKLGETDAAGSLTITGTGDPVLPATPAPVPTRSADSVIALWSNVYDERPVNTWNARYQFSTAEEDFTQVDGDDIIRYRMLNFVGIEFPSIDATEMTHFHINIWTPDATAGGEFKVLLADGGPDGVLGGGDDINHEVTFTPPVLQTEAWVTIEVPLSSFTGLTSRTNLVQMVLSGTLPNVFVDNVYFYIAGESTGGDCTPMDPNLTTFPIDFENCEDFSGVFEAGDGVTGFPTSNPNPSGINTSTGVYQFNKVLGSAWYSGIFHIFPSPFDMTDNMVFKMKIWSPKPNVIVRFQVEKEGGGAVTYQKTATVASANTWTELEFDFSDQPFIDGFTPYDKIVIIPDDFDAGSSDGSVYYIDDVELTTSGGGGDMPPTSGAPAPTQGAADVISIYSDEYTDVPNLGFNLYGGAGFEVVNFGPMDNALKYTWLNANPGNFQVIELGEPNRIDAAAAGMTNFRFDLYFPKEGVENEQFLLKLVDASDFGMPANITINSAVSDPAIAQGTWLQFDYTFAELTALGLAGNAAIQQLVIDLLSENTGEVYVDNIYFYKEGGGGGDMPPTSGAPAPTQGAADVISIYSDEYTDVPNLGFNLYGGAGFEVVNFGPMDNALKYTWLNANPGNFQVIELGEPNRIDAAAAGMTNFRFDLYFPKEGVENEQFLLKLVDASDFGMPANITINSAVSDPAIAQGTWLQFDYTFAELTALGLAGNAAIQQLVIDLLSENTGEVYVDNIYFYKEGGGGGDMPPTSGAPAPTQGAADVISIYSDEYTDVPNLGFNLYGGAGFEVVNFGPMDNALKYTWLNANPGNFQVIELGEPNRIDAAAAGMTNFRFDLYFPKEGVENEQFLLKLVDASDFGMPANITINSAVSDPAIAQGTWLQFDYTFAELTALGLAGNAAIQQLVIDLLSENTGEVYVDNIYFYKEGGGGGDMPPTSGAPAPTQGAADVISIYSDEYTDVPNLGFNLYGGAGFEVVNFGPMDNALKYTWLNANPGNFQVIELGEPNRIDAAAAGMTNFRFDLYFPKEGVENEQFLLKLVDASDFGMPANITINSAVSDPAIAQGTWLQFDYTFAELTALGLAGNAAIQQLVIDLLSENTGEVYVDNIYFYDGSGDVNGCDPPSAPASSFPIDFESCEDLSGVFEGPLPEGFPTTSFPAGNASTAVYQFNKTAGAPWFAGIWHAFDTPFDMTTNKKFTIKIWSPKPNVVIRFAIEKNGNPGSPPSYIDRQTLGPANTWTTLTFDFSDEVFSGGTTGYDQIVIIPDDAGDGSPPADGSIYYIDDITQTN